MSPTSCEVSRSCGRFDKREVGLRVVSWSSLCEMIVDVLVGKFVFDLTELETRLQNDIYAFSRSHVVYSVHWPVRRVNTLIDCWLLP